MSFVQLKEEILKKYPSYMALPLLDRFLVWMQPETEEITETREVDMGGPTPSEFAQTAVLVTYRGKTYTKRFGRLK